MPAASTCVTVYQYAVYSVHDSIFGTRQYIRYTTSVSYICECPVHQYSIMMYHVLECWVHWISVPYEHAIRAYTSRMRMHEHTMRADRTPHTHMRCEGSRNTKVGCAAAVYCCHLCIITLLLYTTYWYIITVYCFVQRTSIMLLHTIIDDAPVYTSRMRYRNTIAGRGVRPPAAAGGGFCRARIYYCLLYTAY
jgi:hypothetical protein